MSGSDRIKAIDLLPIFSACIPKPSHGRGRSYCPERSRKSASDGLEAGEGRWGHGEVDGYRFALTHPSVDICMTGPRTLEELRQNLSVLDTGPMTPEELARVHRIGDFVYGKRITIARRRHEIGRNTPSLGMARFPFLLFSTPC